MFMWMFYAWRFFVLLLHWSRYRHCQRSPVFFVSMVVGSFVPLPRIWWRGCLISQMLGFNAGYVDVDAKAGRSLFYYFCWGRQGPWQEALHSFAQWRLVGSSVPVQSIFFNLILRNSEPFFGFLDSTLWILVVLYYVIDWLMFFFSCKFHWWILQIIYKKKGRASKLLIILVFSWTLAQICYIFKGFFAP